MPAALEEGGKARARHRASGRSWRTHLLNCTLQLGEKHFRFDFCVVCLFCLGLAIKEYQMKEEHAPLFDVVKAQCRARVVPSSATPRGPLPFLPLRSKISFAAARSFAACLGGDSPLASDVLVDSSLPPLPAASRKRHEPSLGPGLHRDRPDMRKKGCEKQKSRNEGERRSTKMSLDMSKQVFGVNL